MRRYLSWLALCLMSACAPAPDGERPWTPPPPAPDRVDNPGPARVELTEKTVEAFVTYAMAATLPQVLDIRAQLDMAKRNPIIAPKFIAVLDASWRFENGVHSFGAHDVTYVGIVLELVKHMGDIRAAALID